MPHPRPLTRTAGALLLAAVAAVAPVALAGPASAEPPSRLAEEVTDSAGVLDAADRAEVVAALDDLADRTPYQLFVVYVRTFDGTSGADWADETAVASGLGRDDLLLAVAVEDRQYQVSVDPDLALTDAQLADVETDRIEPALRDDDWAGAAVAAAEGYADAATGDALGPDGARPGGPDGGLVLGILGGGVLLVAGGVGSAALVRRRRAAAAVRAELEELDGRASSALVAVDEAVQASAQELGFAEAQLGAATVAPFAAALTQARTDLAGAFAARQQLDDGVPDTAPDRRRLLATILETCTRVDTALDAQSAEFDRLRDLHARAPELLADAASGADAVDARAATTATTLADLTARYAPSALVAVVDNVAGARAWSR
ncbi:TPM domain-containing protein [Cellulomonas fimi]|uniref:TPM domain-containing protein n=1 Tax=Cellulomonas fimi TaxID=1708 RepID=UPI00147871EA|nr:TPM domain-containing protein [Cellulomonas fimi]NNH09229.1 TPM domain-containing protein [Cellulomonas fimi]